MDSGWADPPTESDLVMLYAGYQASIERLSPAQLRAELTRVNAELQGQASRTLSDSLLSNVLRSLDQPVSRSSTATDSPPPPDRAAARFSFPPPTPAQLLRRSDALGRKVAATLLARHQEELER